MTEPKPKTYKCKHKPCKNRVGIINNIRGFCSVDCIVKANKAQIEKEYIKRQKQNERDRKDETREKKIKLMTYTQRVNDVKPVYQRWIRERDKDLPCISCGSTTADIWDGGHYKKAEIYRGVIFNEFNCNKQCRKCNKYLGGNESNYRKGLIEKYGLFVVETLEQLANETRNYKWSNEELEEIKLKYSKSNN